MSVWYGGNNLTCGTLPTGHCLYFITSLSCGGFGLRGDTNYPKRLTTVFLKRASYCVDGVTVTDVSMTLRSSLLPIQDLLLLYDTK